MTESTSRKKKASAGRTPRADSKQRTAVRKTYKVFIGGAFPRSESGHVEALLDAKGQPLANVCRCSRKDVRDAVVAARKAAPGWAAATPYLRAQILYRVGEMLEGRREQFEQELRLAGLRAPQARAEVTRAIDCLVYYAGWADKVQQIFSTVNPVSSAHFSFSLLEPMGVVGLVAPQQPGLAGLVAELAPILAGGNAVVTLASSTQPLSAVTFAEVLATSDVPAGVVNLLTGRELELVEPMATHMDINAVVYCRDDAAVRTTIEQQGAANMKRVIVRDTGNDWSPYAILDTQEVKTTWHPVGS